MLFLITSDEPAAIKLNGRLIGVTSSNDISLESGLQLLLFEAAFVFSGGVSGLLIKNGRDFTGNAEITLFGKDVCAVNFLPPSGGGFYRPVHQLKYYDKIQHKATLFFDGGYFLELECQNNYARMRLPAPLKDAEVRKEIIGKTELVCVLGNIKGKPFRSWYGYNGEYTPAGTFFCQSVKADGDKLIITRKHSDMRAHISETACGYINGVLKAKEAAVTPSLPPPKAKRLIPFAFMEAVFSEAYAEAAEYLNPLHFEGILPAQLKNYFGDFSDVLHNGHDAEYSKYVGLKVKKSENLFAVDYYRFEMTGLLIDNIEKV